MARINKNRLEAGPPQEIRLIRLLIAAYFFLLLFEGALRKWVTPGLSTPLLVVRDPIVIVIYFLSFSLGIFPNNKFIGNLTKLAVASTVASFMAGSGLVVTVFGLRTNFLHLPMIFIMARVLTYEDVIKYGKWFVYLSLPMTYVVAQQFQANPDDMINTVAGGSGRQLETSGGKVRSSGTFTFISGVVYYFSFVAAFAIIGLLRKKTFNLYLVFMACASIMLAMVTSGSRSVVAGCAEVFGCTLLMAYFRPRSVNLLFGVIIMLGLVALLVNQSDLFGEGLKFLNLRFEEAASAEMGPIEEFFARNGEILASPLNYSLHAGLFGRGLGTGTNAAAGLGAINGFYGENEWARNIYESGYLLGNLFLCWRMYLFYAVFIASVNQVKRGNYLPIFLWGASAELLVYGQLGQPTTLGFLTMGVGLCLASMKGPVELNEERVQ